MVHGMQKKCRILQDKNLESFFGDKYLESYMNNDIILSFLFHFCL